MKKILCCLVGLLFVYFAIIQTSPVLARSSGPLRNTPPDMSGRTTLRDLSGAAREAVSAALGRDDKSYHISDGFQAQNAAQRLSVDFSGSSVQIRAGVNYWGLTLKGIGREDYTALPEAKPIRQANRLEYDRGAVREWYLNGPLGLEQGFTVWKRPLGKRGIPLGLELAMSGDLRAWVDPDQRGVSLVKADGSQAITYGELRAYDAAGKELDSWLEVNGDRLLVKVRDEQAAYPVTIDPLVQQQKLTALDGAANDHFGCSVSLSSDGNTALIGAQGENSSQGAAYVFVYSESTSSWTEQQKLTASDGAWSENFGISVSLSSDGNTALIGANGKKSGDDWYVGAAYVFVRSGSTWSEQGILTASVRANGDNFGNSVSMSSDGNTALIGAFGKSSSQGAAYVFVRSGSTWSQQQILTAAGSYYFGNSVSLSSDGNTALIGAFLSNSYQGAAYVFVRSVGTWNTTPQILTASDGAAYDQFGNSVSMSSDGNTALIGAFGKSSSQGAAYVFVRSGSTWSQQGEKLTASDGAAYDNFGISVSLSSDGNTALIGADGEQYLGETRFPEAAYVFVRSGITWSQQQKLTASGGAAEDFFGNSVSLSSDGNTALIGGSGQNTRQGAAYVFSPPPLPPSNPSFYIIPNKKGGAAVIYLE